MMAMISINTISECIKPFLEQLKRFSVLQNSSADRTDQDEFTPMSIYIHTYISRIYPAKGIFNRDNRLFTKITYIHIESRTPSSSKQQNLELTVILKQKMIVNAITLPRPKRHQTVNSV